MIRTNTPAKVRFLNHADLAEYAEKLEAMLIDGTEQGAARCDVCENVKDYNDFHEDGNTCQRCWKESIMAGWWR